MLNEGIHQQVTLQGIDPSTLRRLRCSVLLLLLQVTWGGSSHTSIPARLQLAVFIKVCVPFEHASASALSQLLLGFLLNGVSHVDRNVVSVLISCTLHTSSIYVLSAIH